MSAAHAAGRIGPNAITQLTDALERAQGPEATARLVRAVGLGRYLERPPSELVDEAEVIALHAAVRERLPSSAARGIARTAGLGTARYLLVHRIPRAAQAILRVLPARLASRMLLAAIARHAWTFAGTGRFTATPGRPVVICLEDCALCRGARAPEPVCDYYAATFEGLFARLVHAGSIVRETACHAAGAPACRFEISWPAMLRH